MIYQKWSEVGNGSTLRAGNFVSFTFNDERFVACLLNHEYGLYSSEGTSVSGFQPFVITTSGYLAHGITNLRKLDDFYIVLILTRILLKPENAHLVEKAEKFLDDRGSR